MNPETIGRLIAELRKARQMTQRELAEQLNISDKAVSKWERGLGYPDIELLPPLSSILGITTTELLNGAKAESDAICVEEIVVSALAYGKQTEHRKAEFLRSIAAAAFSVLLLVGILVVLVVDAATSGGISWSLIPVSSCIFAWLVLFPILKLGGKGVIGSLAAFSAFIIPFLYVLDTIIDKMLRSNTLLFPMGIRIAPLSIVFLWAAYLLFKRLPARKLFVTAVLILLASPLNYFTNTFISAMLHQPYTGARVVLNTLAPIIAAAILFLVDSLLRKRTSG